MNNILVSVIIVNYNGIKFLDDCFTSIKKNLENIPFEILVVDNLSTDESVEFIKKNYPEVILIESTINLGFGQGNNLGVKHANGKYLFLFNNDTILLNSIDPAIKLLEENKNIGVIGANMLNKDKEYLYACGYFPNALNMLIFKKFLMHKGDFSKGIFTQQTYEVDWLTGSFLILSKQLYNTINGFDKDYFMYVEDVDLCKKIEQQNLKRVFVPSISYIHYVGFNPKKNPLIIKGYRIFIKKHYTILKQIILNCSLYVTQVVKYIKYQ